MQIYPAIDLQNYQCVRLHQGKFDTIKIYHFDPLAVAQQFKASGANWLHLVDLDGAKNPDNNQLFLIENIIKKTSLNIQTGGGIRSERQVEELLTYGAARVIIGSYAIKNKKEVMRWLKYYGPEKLVLAVDIKISPDNQAYVYIHGWQQATQFTLESILKDYGNDGLKHVLCTDISQDGTLQGPNVELYRKIVLEFPDLHLQASGGISTINDIQVLKKIKLKGAILGRALYENKFSLQEALKC